MSNTYKLRIVPLYLAYLVTCTQLTNPDNGVINCSLGDNGIPSYADTCSFTCNTGYELTGSDTRTCQNDGSWSGSNAACQTGEYHRLIHYSYTVFVFLNQARTWFFKIALSVCMCVLCMCVFVSVSVYLSVSPING